MHDYSEVGMYRIAVEKAKDRKVPTEISIPSGWGFGGMGKNSSRAI